MKGGGLKYTHHLVFNMNLERALEIDGWMAPDELQWLAETASKSKTVVEFGCYKGRSTRAMADNLPEFGRIYAVDPWNGTYYSDNGNVHEGINTDVYDEFENNLRDHIIADRVVPFKSHSKNFLRNIKANFVFIDGDHRFLEVLNDIKIGLGLLKDEGIIAGHDFIHTADWPGVRKAVEQIFGKDIKLVNSIWWRQE